MTSTSRTAAAAAAADVAAVLAFAWAGRRSHQEAQGLADLGATAWPFLAGLGVGWLVTRAWRRPLAPMRTGAVVAVVTVAAGMGLRAATGQGTAAPFVAVATVANLVLLAGWRGLLQLRRRGAGA